MLGTQAQGTSASAGLAPQGFDFGQVAQQLAGAAAQALPGLIMGLLSAHPQVQQMRPQSANGLAPQSLINIGLQTPFGGGGFSLFDSAPQLSPQGFDFGQVAQQIAGAAAKALPGLIMGLLSANPQVQKMAPQNGGNLAPQSLFNIGLQTPFGGGGFSLFDASPQLAPQGFNFGQIAQQLVGTAAQQVSQQIPSIVSGILSSLSAAPRVGNA